MGFLGQQLFQISTKNPFYTLLIGLFTQLLFLQFYLIFGASDLVFYSTNALISSYFIYSNRNLIYAQFKKLKKIWAEIHLTSKSILILILISIWAKSATIPYLVDNETYYVQTIKWLNEYGLVKGLGNLHIYFGQMSGWHLLQSSFNFGFVAHRLNDLNGFLLFVVAGFSLYHLQLYFKLKLRKHLFLGLISLWNILLFQFITSPSPDLPIYLLTPIALYLFYDNFDSYKGDFKLLSVITILMILVKITIAPILILPLVLLWKHRLIQQNWKWIICIGWFASLGFVLKNFITTGYLLYPLKIGKNLTKTDWQVPESYVDFFGKLTAGYGWKHLNAQQLETMNFGEKFISWCTESHGFELIFNNLFLVGLLISFFFTFQSKAFRWIWVTIFVQFVILQFTSPQYRFFLGFTFCIYTLILAKIFLNKPNWVKILISVNALIIFLSLGFNFDLKSKNFKNSQPQMFEQFQFSQILKPAPNVRYEYQYKNEILGNLEYNNLVSPNDLIFVTGDGDLPCVNSELIDYTKKKFQIIPQLRTSQLKDGFKSVTNEF